MEFFDWIYAVVLGVVQGVSEFLPISSSAHLIAVSWLFNGVALPLTLNIGLHLGTVCAVLFYFRLDWVRIIRAFFDFGRTESYRFEFRCLIPGLIVGTIPAGVIGLLFKDDIEAIFHNPSSLIAPLAIIGIVLWLVDAKSPSKRTLSSLTVRDALIVGVFQACALIPGTSRSGATITGARFLGLSREDAARFSFLLGTPAMLGAAVLESSNILDSLSNPVFYIGFVVSAVTGIITIHYLLKFVKHFGFLVFAIYRILIALILYFLVST
ncbi:MAG: undecaprenyl-diphosphatase UppP [Pseudobacteriovorax sp.]|nr:undecaprenyl-diphosphatase UppP [Pseudobacteriovorax sp.]